MTAPSRLVWLIDQLGPGGAERLALHFAAAPGPWSIELVALHAAPPGSLERLWGPQLEPLRGRLHCIGIRGLDDAVGWWRLLGLLARWRPALIHTHLRYATVWGGAAATLLRRPYVTTVHHGPQPDATRRQRLAAACERFSRRRAARVVYVSRAARQAWGRVAQRERAVVIGNGVRLPDPPAPRPQLRRERGLAASACVFTTVAVVRPRKGWRTWLAAAQQVIAERPHACFVWVGGGPDWPALRAAVEHSPLRDHVVLPGPCSDVSSWLRASDVFLFPSEEEAQPTAVMEAMAAGLPVIASRLPAIEEVLGGCGLFVPPRDARALAHAALAWSGPDNAAAGAAAAAAQRRALGPLGEDLWRRRLAALYEEVLAR